MPSDNELQVRPATQSASHRSPRMPERVLIVYEHPTLATTLKDALRLGFPDIEVAIAETVNSALEQLRHLHPNVVLTGVSDYIDGRSLLTETRRHPATKDIPIVALATGVDTCQDERDLFAHGFA